jgi:hypothetical protein
MGKALYAPMIALLGTQVDPTADDCDRPPIASRRRARSRRCAQEASQTGLVMVKRLLGFFGMILPLREFGFSTSLRHFLGWSALF